MPPVKKKARTRRQRAADSRAKVLAAAREAFLESGYHGATIAAIADGSGFAVQTVSYFFGTKARLLSQLIRTTIEDAIADTGAPLSSNAWTGAGRDGTPEELLDAFVSVGHRILVAVSPLMDVARVGGLTDDEVAEVYAYHEDWRTRDYTTVVNALHERGGLRHGITPQQARDVTLTVFGHDTYRVLLVDRGWTPAEVSAWMGQTLRQQLLAPQADEADPLRRAPTR